MVPLFVCGSTRACFIIYSGWCLSPAVDVYFYVPNRNSKFASLIKASNVPTVQPARPSPTGKHTCRRDWRQKWQSWHRYGGDANIPNNQHDGSIVFEMQAGQTAQCAGGKNSASNQQ
eukprot:353864-Chlamydomonas_euryale.AAC.2